MQLAGNQRELKQTEDEMVHFLGTSERERMAKHALSARALPIDDAEAHEDVQYTPVPHTSHTRGVY